MAVNSSNVARRSILVTLLRGIAWTAFALSVGLLTCGYFAGFDVRGRPFGMPVWLWASSCIEIQAGTPCLSDIAKLRSPEPGPTQLDVYLNGGTLDVRTYPESWAFRWASQKPRTIPLWPITGLAAIWPAGMVSTAFRRHRLRRRFGDCCRVCGYPRCGNPTSVCPECGTVQVACGGAAVSTRVPTQTWRAFSYCVRN